MTELLDHELCNCDSQNTTSLGRFVVPGSQVTDRSKRHASCNIRPAEPRSVFQSLCPELVQSVRRMLVH